MERCCEVLRLILAHVGVGVSGSVSVAGVDGDEDGVGEKRRREGDEVEERGKRAYQPS
jgi:hypothetical protein